MILSSSTTKGRVMDLQELKIKLAFIRKTGGGNPRIHPNGFIQLDLESGGENWHESHKQGHSGGRVRLHIWNPPNVVLPHQATVNEIHDHVFDMHSHVLKGILWQKLYNFIPMISYEDVDAHNRPTHEKYQAVYNKTSDSRLESTGEKGWIRLNKKFPVYSGETYEQAAFTLHDTGAQGCVITLMTKQIIREGTATVVCPINSPPDNSFDRVAAMPADKIWEAIEGSL
jgi:hypothetical protein